MAENRETLASVLVRPGLAGDLAAVAEVHVRSWQETYVSQVPQEYLEDLSVEGRLRGWAEMTAGWEWPNPDLHVLVDDDGKVVGFATTSPSRDSDASDSTGEVPSIYTRKDAWGRGNGRALMTAALDRLRQSGYETATLWVLDTNTRARRFYEAGGWAWDGTSKGHQIGGAAVTELRYRIIL